MAKSKHIALGKGWQEGGRTGEGSAAYKVTQISFHLFTPRGCRQSRKMSTTE